AASSASASAAAQSAAAQLNGKWVKASALSQTSASSSATSSAAQPIADSAVRLTFTDASGKTIKSVDWTKTNAKKGDTLGQLTRDNNGVYTWNLGNLSATQLQSLKDTISDALNGTGYGFSVDNNAAVLAQAKTGSELKIPLTKGNTVYQTLTPLAYNTATGATNNSAATATKLAKNSAATTSLSDQYFSAKASATPQSGDALVIKGDKNSKNYDLDLSQVDAKTGAANSTLQAQVKAYVDAGNTLDSLNKQVSDAAANFFVAPTSTSVNDLFSGTDNATYTGTDVMNYLAKHSNFSTLKSPVFPVFTSTGSVASFSQFNFTARQALGGTFGSGTTTVYYSYNSALPSTNVSFPTSTGNGYSPF
ncbi:hypothetical protein ACFQ22_08565, partial [Lentilactobacillus raoultii]